MTGQINCILDVIVLVEKIKMNNYSWFFFLSFCLTTTVILILTCFPASFCSVTNVLDRDQRNPKIKRL